MQDGVGGYINFWYVCHDDRTKFSPTRCNGGLITILSNNTTIDGNGMTGPSIRVIPDNSSYDNTFQFINFAITLLPLIIPMTMVWAP